MAILYVDYEGGDDGNSGTSFANRKKTISSANSVANPGDEVRIMATPAATSMGTATWTNLSKVVAIPSALTANISLCDSTWTAAVNVTTTTTATRKQGAVASSIAIGAAFISGQVARESFSAIDLSAYQQVSFWIRTSAAIAASTLELRLCSDTLGLFTVNTIPIPAIPNVNFWTPITFDTAGALGASIQSVTLHATSDPGTVTIFLDNILACKASSSADSITLNSLIGKNTESETFWALQSINGTNLTLDAHPEAIATAGRGYYGTTETVTTYKIEPVQTDITAATAIFLMNKSGSNSLPINFSGGWDRVNMSTQIGKTYYTGRNSAILGVSTQTFNFLNFSELCMVRYSTGINVNGSNNVVVSDCVLVANVSGMSVSSNTCEIRDCVVTSCNTGFVISGQNCKVRNLVTNCNIGSAIQITASSNSTLSDILSANNGARGLYTVTNSDIKIKNFVGKNNATEDFRNDSGNPLLINPSFGSATHINNTGVLFTGGTVRVQGYNLDPDDNRTILDVGFIQSVTDINRRTPTGYAWKFSPTSSNATENYPLRLAESIKVACVANSLVTAKVWVKRSNIGITARLFCEGGQLAGVPSDVYADASGAVGTYEEVSITFTPTESGVISLELRAFGGTTYNAWFDDMSIYQA